MRHPSILSGAVHWFQKLAIFFAKGMGDSCKGYAALQSLIGEGLRGEIECLDVSDASLDQVYSIRSAGDRLSSLTGKPPVRLRRLSCSWLAKGGLRQQSVTCALGILFPLRWPYRLLHKLAVQKGSTPPAYAKGAVKVFMAWVLVFLTACLRLARLQRSGQLSYDVQLLCAYCIGVHACT